MSGISTCLLLTAIMFFKMRQCNNVTKMEPFVVNGDFAKIKKFPHSVFIYANCGGKWTCGSSILNQKILLTAAHCFKKCRKRGSITAFAGHRNIKKSIVIRLVARTLIHEHYNELSIQNDIGLLLLQHDLPLGNKIKRVIINKQNNIGKQAEVAGWGFINDKEKKRTDLLMWTSVKVRSDSTCRKIGKLKPGTLCAGSFNENDGRPSRGDSGSALMTNNYSQIGLVSFRIDNYPALVIFTNISYYYNWIRSNSRSLYCGEKYTSRLISDNLS